MTNKFKVGDKARITGNTNSHHFEVGEVVEVVGIGSLTYHCANNEKGKWFVKEHDLAPLTPALTLQEKFEQGWEFTHKSGAVVIEMFTFQNGHIAVRYTGKDDLDYTCTWADFLAVHTITPPAPKVERRFTSINCKNEGMVVAGRDFNTLEQAKENIFPESTCILEHEKQGDKWVFVKAHTV